MTSTQPQPIYEPEPACESCGVTGDGVSLEEHEDEGDASVGYGPLTLIYCSECWEQMTATRRLNG